MQLSWVSLYNVHNERKVLDEYQYCIVIDPTPRKTGPGFNLINFLCKHMHNVPFLLWKYLRCFYSFNSIAILFRAILVTDPDPSFLKSGFGSTTLIFFLLSRQRMSKEKEGDQAFMGEITHPGRPKEFSHTYLNVCNNNQHILDRLPIIPGKLFSKIWTK